MVIVRIIALSLLLTLSGSLFASIAGQTEMMSEDTASIDLVPSRFFSGFEVYMDYGKVLTLATKFESKYEGGINFRFYGRYILAGEFGYAILDPLKAYDNALKYTITGSYFRAGIDY
jgi:hypothetical protein